MLFSNRFKIQMVTNAEIKEIKRQMKKKRKKKRQIPKKDFLSSGATMFNLCCTDSPNRAFYKRGIFLMPGDSDSGKSFLSLTCLAEAAKNPHFKDYRFIHDAPEGGALMDMVKFFGKEVARRIELPPFGTSKYLEDFYDNLDELHEQGIPFIKILDSMDALDTMAEAKKFKEQKKARRKNKEAAGSYGMDKAKMNSQGLKRAESQLDKSKSILIIIAQTRDNVGFGAQYIPKTRAGGRALKFYTRLEVWSSVYKNLTKTINGKKRQIGILSKLKITKNHITGGKSECLIPIFHAYGIDDLLSCINFLIDEEHWKGTNVNVTAKEFEFKGKKKDLIHLIESGEREVELQMLVAEVWNEIKAQMAGERKPKYV